ncbi:MAG: HAD-IIIA family hydrolase [Verrucomicrobia bacterium]|nr:HAD-IIIA family hydrolase [Verrucomicrobiota bacterium]
MRAELKQAVILAGGMGTRLGGISRDCPKPILPVAGKPFLSYLIENLRRYGIRDFVVCVGHLGEKVIDTLGDGSALGVRISYSIENVPLGTGGCVKNAGELLDNQFLMLNGDTLFDFNYSDLLSKYSEKFSDGILMALRRVENVSRYGAIKLEDYRIVSFQDKALEGPGWINGGVYVMKRATIEGFPYGNFSIENDYFPSLATHGKLYGAKYDGFFIDIGIPETYESAQLLIPERCKRPIAFLDRDGVINVNHGYVVSPDRFDLIPGALEAIRHFNENGYYVLVVTNQAGIARGYYSELQFHDFMNWVQLELRKHGAHFDGYYFSPNHPEGTIDRYSKSCFFRKPNPGMLLRGLSEWPTFKEESFLIGDKESDVLAAEKAGIKGYLFEEENLYSFCKGSGLI